MTKMNGNFSRTKCMTFSSSMNFVLDTALSSRRTDCMNSKDFLSTSRRYSVSAQSSLM